MLDPDKLQASIERQIEAGRKHIEHMRANMSDAHRAVLLGPWIDLAERAGVPFVPAEFSEPFPSDEILESLDGHKDSARAFLKAFEWAKGRIAEALKAGRKVSARYEHCSTGWLKHAASQGEEWSKTYADINPDCPRMVDLSIPFSTLRLVVRPWVEAERIAGYPVEFRVFYGPDGFQGYRAIIRSAHSRRHPKSCGQPAKPRRSRRSFSRPARFPWAARWTF